MSPGYDQSIPGDHEPHSPYRSSGTDDSEVVFPFHWPCYSLLARVLTGAFTPGRIDKNLLYSTFLELGTRSYRLDIDYGKPDPPTEEYWDCIEGQELLVSNPASTPYLDHFMKATIASDDFKLPSFFDDITAKVILDPFKKLPYDIIYKICLFLPSGSILHLCMASKQIFTILNTNSDFWRKCIKHKMPWFFELQKILDDPEITKEKDLMGLFRWINRETTPRMFMSGHFMSIANRQRIWNVCQIIARPYLVKLREGNSCDPDHIERTMLSDVTCAFMPVVSCPLPREKDLTSVFWVQSWDEIYKNEKELETFWNDDEGSLVGISLATNGQRRLFGRDDTTNMVSTINIKMKKEEWIKGFILHIPAIDLCDAATPSCEGGPRDPNRTSTCPKGITVHSFQALFNVLIDLFGR